MIFFEVKHDTKHKKWHRLSVRLHPQCPYAEVIKVMYEHLYAYAGTNQMDQRQISIRVVEESKGVIHHRASEALTVRPKA